MVRNEVRVSPLWAHSCRAYNVQIELEPRTKASLEKTQRALKRAEPTLVACPRQTLHVSIAWLLAVHASYPVPKDSLWERYAEEWMAELNRIAAQSTGFRITYETSHGSRAVTSWPRTLMKRGLHSVSICPGDDTKGSVHLGDPPRVTRWPNRRRDP
jgi:hypothetical protein